MSNIFRNGYRLPILFLFLVGIVLASGVNVSANQQLPVDFFVYTDTITNDWSTAGSWGTTIDPASTDYVQDGSYALSVRFDSAWTGMFLSSNTYLNSADYTALRFWAHGGPTGGQTIKIVLLDENANGSTEVYHTLPANQWTDIAISLDALGAPTLIRGIMIQESNGAAQPALYLDQLHFVGDDGSGGATSDIYIDNLDANWVNWSWSTDIDFFVTNPVQSGTQALGVTYTGPWAGFYLHANENIDLFNYTSLRFGIHGGANGGQRINVAAVDQASNTGPGIIVDATANQWTTIDIPLSDLGSPALLSGIIFQEFHGAAQPELYFDNIQLIGFDNGGGDPPISVDVTVDLLNLQHPINPYIYGMNWADPALAAELSLPVNRWGGNAVTRFNWELDVSNRASDWFFENIPNETDMTQLPFNSSSDQFITTNLNNGSDTLLTIPTIGWTPKSRNVTCGYSVALYGAQQSTDPWNSDCGNGIDMAGNPITNNDPTDTSMAIGTPFVQDWMTHLIGRFGNSNNDGVRFYALDNEPMLWNHTHRDVHPDPAGYDEVRDDAYEYAPAIKAIDPAAQVFGPAVWGWTAYFYSAIDAASGNWNNPPDYTAHGSVPFLQWYLQEMADYEAENGLRILDYLDIHYYPQEAGVALQPAGSTATQRLRLRSTRALWDPTYTSESWINEDVQLIPRMQSWIAGDYPGTKLALTEYNWGGLEHINGALAQADVLGIFGRENLDFATLWDPPTSGQPGAYAFRMYRNYDGNGSQFGDRSLVATSADQDSLAVYAARRSSDNATTIMVVNKALAAVETDFQLQGNLAAATAEVYQYSSADLNQIVQLSDQLILADGSFGTTYPANSITLYVIPLGVPTAVHMTHLPIVTANTNTMVQQAIVPFFLALSPFTLVMWLRES